MTGKDGDPIEHHEVSVLEVIESRLAAIDVLRLARAAATVPL